MKQRLLVDLTMDDQGRVTRCRMGTPPGCAPAFLIEQDGDGCMDRCSVEVRKFYRMAVYRKEFDALTSTPSAA